MFFNVGLVGVRIIGLRSSWSRWDIGRGGFGAFVELSHITVRCDDLCCPTVATWTVQAPGILGPLIATSVAEYRLRGITLGAGRAASALRGHISLSALIGGKGGVSEASDDTGGSKGSERQTGGLSGRALRWRW